MSHRNARLTPTGRLLLVERVRVQGMPVAHVAKAMGVSRQCAHRWVGRFDEEGLAGLEDRSSRPHRSPRRTDQPGGPGAQGAARAPLRAGAARPICRVPERTISRILRRDGVPRLPECDPMTGEVIRASRSTARRYERDRPGELVHVDVKKLGPHPRRRRLAGQGRAPKTTSDHARSATTTSTRWSTTTAASPTPRSSPTRQGTTCAAFLARAAAAFAAAGIERIDEVMTDNAFNYR